MTKICDVLQILEEQEGKFTFDPYCFDDGEWEKEITCKNFGWDQFSECIYVYDPTMIGCVDYGRPCFSTFYSPLLPQSELLDLGIFVNSEKPNIKYNIFIDDNKFDQNELSQLRDLGYVIMFNDGRMLLNPLISPFISQRGKEVLDSYLPYQTNFAQRYLSLVKCFYRDDKGEIYFISDNSLQELHDELPSFSTGVSISASNAFLQTMWGKELEMTRFEKAKKIQVKEKTEMVEKTIDLVTLRSKTTSGKCPYCGQMTKERPAGSGTFQRHFQDIPVTTGRPLFVHIKGARKYMCRNPDCDHYNHSFHEQFDFLTPQGRRSNRLNALILSCAINESFLGTQRSLGLWGVKVGDDAIRKIVMDIKFPDDKNIEAIGVDDISLRKGVSYLTVIYALSDHRLLAVLDGRDGTKLEEWLNEHPKIRIICRDRASSYAKHIDDWAREHGITVKQIADRFHLVKNFIDHLNEGKFTFIPVLTAFDTTTGHILDSIPGKTATPVAQRPDEAFLNSTVFNNEPSLDESGKPFLFNISLQKNEEAKVSYASKEDSGVDEETADQKDAADSRKTKYKIACAVRKSFDPSQPKKPQYEKLAEIYNIKPVTVARYIRMSPEEVAALGTYKPRKETDKEIDQYKYLIYNMLKAHISIGDVFWYVLNKGYKNSITNLANYILAIHKIALPEEVVPPLKKLVQLSYPEEVVIYTRKQIVKYLLTKNPKTKKDKFLEEHEKEILNKYPEAQKILNAYTDFYRVIMGDSVEKLKELCKRTDHLKEVEGFYKHILDVDLDAVSNAIQYTWSSGFVEGNNNRMKLIERIGYGRMKLKTLIHKAMLAMYSTLEGFELGGIVKWAPLSEDIDSESEFWKAMSV